MADAYYNYIVATKYGAKRISSLDIVPRLSNTHSDRSTSRLRRLDALLIVQTTANASTRQAELAS